MKRGIEGGAKRRAVVEESGDMGVIRRKGRGKRRSRERERAGRAVGREERVVERENKG